MYRQKWVTAATARAVKALYKELWNQPPRPCTPAEKRVVRQARERAEKREWALPAAWDDDLIDDPLAEPEDCRRSQRCNWPGLLESAAELARRGLERAEIADRLEVPRAALDTAIAREARRQRSRAAGQGGMSEIDRGRRDPDEEILDVCQMR